ncbi:hypothetical protein DERF_000841 [Dermatophagoides farinae]|uniref:Uncharacterized protein n=1 Tax=Dermatophagoides farinae TaxID=6954 RepID=A0A922L8R7_DERFA|nr:hypothetical protein DERF_000841 [Dermatophagoides farinae]
MHTLLQERANDERVFNVTSGVVGCQLDVPAMTARVDCDCAAIWFFGKANVLPSGFLKIN